MLRASRSWCTPPPGCFVVSSLPSPPLCSTVNPWAFMHPRSWCRMRGAMVSRCGRWTCSTVITSARWNSTAHTLVRWHVLGARHQRDLVRHMSIDEARPLLRKPTEGEDLVADYAQLGLTLGRHPLALLRERLTQLRFRTSACLQTWPHKKAVRVAVLVTGRQRPGTATGGIFLTLEDEFGSINVVVWNDLTSRQRNEVLSGRMLGVSGVVERAEGVIHVIAGRLEDHTVLLGRLATSSRDFH